MGYQRAYYSHENPSVFRQSDHQRNSAQRYHLVANTLLEYRNEEGKPYSQTYLKTIHNQLSAIFNHAVKYYGLSGNPAAKVGNMGKAQTKEMEFWTEEEYAKFAEVMMDKPISYYAFEMLYWCGILHELIHFLYPHHNKDFYDLLTIHMPDWQNRKKQLDYEFVLGV